MPAIVLPQFLLCGLLVSHETRWPAGSRRSPPCCRLYAVDAMQRITVEPDVSGRIVADVAIVLAGVIVLALALGAATLRRRTARNGRGYRPGVRIARKR